MSYPKKSQDQQKNPENPGDTYECDMVLVSSCTTPGTRHLHIWLGGGFTNIFCFHPYLGKIPILTHIFQGGWNHQLAEF